MYLDRCHPQPSACKGSSLHALILGLLGLGVALLLSACSPSAAPSLEAQTLEANDEANARIEISNTDPKVPSDAAGEAPATPEELQMTANAAEVLNVPYNGEVICTIGKPFYDEGLDMTVRSISFYEDGKLCAGVNCSEDGTPVANFVYY